MRAVVCALALPTASASSSTGLRGPSPAPTFQAATLRGRAPPLRTAVAASAAGDEVEGTSGQRRPLRPSEREFIIDAPSRKNRPPPPDIPTASPVMRSSTYNLSKGGEAELFVPKGEDERPEEEEAVPANTLEWALKSVDQNLNAAEKEPPIVAQKVWEVARGPVGQKVGKAAATGAKAAAQAGLTVGAEAVKRAAPIAGWAAKKTGGAALGAIGSGIKGVLKGDKKKGKDKK